MFSLAGNPLEEVLRGSFLHSEIRGGRPRCRCRNPKQRGHACLVQLEQDVRERFRSQMQQALQDEVGALATAERHGSRPTCCGKAMSNRDNRSVPCLAWTGHVRIRARRYPDKSELPVLLMSCGGSRSRRLRRTGLAAQTARCAPFSRRADTVSGRRCFGPRGHATRANDLSCACGIFPLTGFRGTFVRCG